MFRHGVASADPLHDRVLIWTRVTPPSGGPTDVTWTVARDADLGDVVASGTVVAEAAADHTVTVDVEGLSPATTYWYGFSAGGARAGGGRTPTPPPDRGGPRGHLPPA